jgi:hypothetical protein
MAATKTVEVAFAPDIQVVEFRIKAIGNGYIAKAWSASARESLIDKTVKRQLPTPDEQFSDARHVLTVPTEDGLTDGIPAAAFARAIVDASYRFAKYKSTQVRGAFTILTDYEDQWGCPCVPIIAAPPVKREDLVYNQNTNPPSPALSYRPWYRDWEAVLQVEFNANQMQPDKIGVLIMLAGAHIGVGSRRPEKEAGSNFGRFTLTGAE